MKTDTPIAAICPRCERTPLVQDSEELFCSVCEVHFDLALREKRPVYKCPDCGDELIYIRRTGGHYCNTCMLPKKVVPTKICY